MKTLTTLLILLSAFVATAQPTIPKRATKIIVSYPGSTYGQALTHLKRIWAESGIILSIDTATGTYTTGPIELPRCAGTCILTGLCHTVADTTWITTTGTYYSVPTAYGSFTYPWAYTSGAAKCTFKQTAELLIHYYGDTRVYFQ